jgi:hypothetical protein
MPNLKLIGEDLTGMSFYSSGGDVTGYPAAYLSTYYQNEQWRSLTSASGDYIAVDLGTGADASRNRSGIAVVNHNWSGIMATGYIQITASDTSDFSGGNVTALQPLSTLTDPLLVPFTSAYSTKRYWRVQFAGNMNWAPRAGQIFFGEIVDFGFPYDLPYQSGGREFRTTSREMLNGLIRTHQTSLGRRTFKLTFKGEKGGISDTVKTAWRSLYSRVRGPLRPFAMLDADGTSAYYVHLEGEDDPLDTFRYNVNSIELKMREAMAQ